MGLFTKEVKLKDLRSPEQIKLGQSFLSSLSNGISNFTPGSAFPNSLNVNASSQEELGLDRLNQFANNSLGDNEAFQAGKNNILSVLSGGFNPDTSDTYKALRNELDREKQKAIDEARRGAAFRRNLFSTGSQRVEGDILTDTSNRASSVLAQLMEQERERQTNAASQALGIGQIEANEPLRQAEALTTIGALPRLIEEANLNRALQDFLRQRQEQQNALQLSAEASNSGGRLLGKDSYTQTTGLGTLAKLAGTAAAMYFSGGLGGLGSAIGGGLAGAAAGGGLGGGSNAALGASLGASLGAGF